MTHKIGIVVGLAMLAGTTSAAQAPDPKKVDEGKKAYVAEKCERCHMIDGKGAKKGPLDGVGKKLSAADIRKWFTAAEEMEAKLAKPPTGTNRMSAALKTKKLTEVQIDALVAYMQSLVKS